MHPVTELLYTFAVRERRLLSRPALYAESSLSSTMTSENRPYRDYCPKRKRAADNSREADVPPFTRDAYSDGVHDNQPLYTNLPGPVVCEYAVCASRTGMKFKVALLQIAPDVHDPSKNLAKGLQYCREAKRLGADLAVFPELWSIGAKPCPAGARGQRLWMRSAIGRNGDFFRGFAALAQELGMNIAVTYLEAAQPKPRNSVAILNSQGEVALNYSKVCICDFGPDGDNAAGCDVGCAPGESFGVCELTGAEGAVKLGAMICADREFPEPATQLMLQGAELIIIPNACDWDELRTAGLITRTLENLVGVAMANYPRPKANGNSRAYSCAAWEAGKTQNLLIAVAGEREELLVADFDVDAIRQFRISESWRLHYRHCLATTGRTSR